MVIAVTVVAPAGAEPAIAPESEAAGQTTTKPAPPPPRSPAELPKVGPMPRPKVNIPTYRPKPTGARHVLAKDKPLKLEGGRTITWTPVGDTRSVTISNGTAEQTLKLSMEFGEAELDLYGLVVVLTPARDSLIATVGGATPAPLTDAEMMTLFATRAAKAKLPAAESSVTSQDLIEGVYTFKSVDLLDQPVWIARLGMFSRRLWFEKPSQPPPEPAPEPEPAVEKPAPPPPPPPPTRARTLTPRPNPKGSRHRLALNKPLKLKGNRTVVWTSVGAEQQRRGESIAVHAVTVSDGKQQTSLRLDARDGETEVDLLGLAAVFTAEPRALAVTVVGALPAPLDDEQVVGLIEARAAKAKLEVRGAKSIEESDGFRNATALDKNGRAIWRARLGLYSRRLWFEQPPQPRSLPAGACLDNPLAKGCM